MEKRGYLITFGGWYQRTTLHLTEVYSFFKDGNSRIPLSKTKLKKIHSSLNLKKVERITTNLEFVYAITKEGIEIKYYEDGLYILQITSNNIKASQKLLSDYFEKIFNPAISYLFSLGAPTPKVLANIKITHPTVIGSISPKHKNYQIDEKSYGKIYSKISSKDITVYKTQDYIFIITSPLQKNNLISLIEMQIFFREFKDQLQRYLEIHRKAWEEIDDIKEREKVKGTEIAELRLKLDSYQNTISLINNRINQMSTYARTRAEMSKQLKVEEHLLKLFEYKFETLFNTLEYTKEIWNMTNDYVNSAIQVIVEAAEKYQGRNIESIQMLAAVGVVSGILGYLTNTEIPKFSKTGIFLFLALILLAYIINKLIIKLYGNVKYKLKFKKRLKEI